MVGFFGCIPRFLKAHSDLVLMSLGSVGLVGTAVAVAKEAPEAETAVMEAELDKMKAWAEENGTNEVPKEVGKLSVWEKTKTVAPIYWPAILLGTATLGSFWGAFIIGAKQQAALVAAYGGVLMQFAQYREEIKSEYGEEADKRALEFSKQKVRELQEEVEQLKIDKKKEIEQLKADNKKEIKRLREENGPYLYGITTLPGIIFEAKPVDMQESLYHYNRNLVLRGEASFDELYQLIGIPETCYDKAMAASYGYNEYVNETDYGVRYADFEMRGVFAKDGRMINMITPAFAPYHIDCFDADFDGFASEYPDYDETKAKAIQLAENFLNEGCNRLTKIKHPSIVSENFYLM